MPVDQASWTAAYGATGLAAAAPAFQPANIQVHSDAGGREEHTQQRQRRSTAKQNDGLVQISGPCFCKMLVPNHVAGAIIGRQGSTIAHIELLTRCQLQISAGNAFFPGTTDRIVVIGGNMRSLEDCITMVLQRLHDFSANKDRPVLLKLVVPNSAVSALIGRGGHVARQLSSTMDCRINVSPRVGNLKERLVLLSGSHGSVARAALQVVRDVQADPHFAEHLCLRYENVDIPLGAWAGAKAAPLDPEAPLLSPSDARGYTKRKLIEHLRKTAPREILMKYGLLGNINNTVKSKSSQELSIVVAETWLARGGDQAPAGLRLDDGSSGPGGSSSASLRSSSPRGELVLALHDADLIRARTTASLFDEEEDDDAEVVPEPPRALAAAASTSGSSARAPAPPRPAPRAEPPWSPTPPRQLTPEAEAAGLGMGGCARSSSDSPRGSCGNEGGAAASAPGTGEMLHVPGPLRSQTCLAALAPHGLRDSFAELGSDAMGLLGSLGSLWSGAASSSDQGGGGETGPS